MKTALSILALLIGLSISHTLYGQDWHWATSLPGGLPGSVETDASGNIYVTGKFSGEASFGSQTLVSNGGPNLYVVKYNSAMEVQWAKSFGGPDTAPFAYDIAINPATGDISVTGTFRGSWPVGAVSFSSSGDADIFILTLDAQGNIKWIRRGGGSGFERSHSITMDRIGNVFITGSINNDGGEVRFDELQVPGISYVDMFLAKYSPSGQVLWVKNAGVAPITNYFSQTSGSDVAVDSQGNVYVTGMKNGNTTFDHLELPAGTSMYGYVAKYSTDGLVQWVKQVGTTPATLSFSDSYPQSIAVDGADNIVLTGSYAFGAQFDHISLLSPDTESAIYIAKLDNTGNAVWAKKAEGVGYKVKSCNVRIARDGSYLVAGQFMGNTSFGNMSITGNGSHDVFVANYTADGTVLWVKGAGGSGDEDIMNLAEAPSGYIYIVGSAAQSAVFHPTVVEAGPFIAKLSTVGVCSVAVPDLAAELSLCSGESTKVGVAAQAGYTYEWYPSKGLSDPRISSPTLTLTNLFETVRSHTYTLTATGPDGCTASDQIRVTVSPKPNANAGPDQEVCAGGLVQIGAQPVKGVSYSWTVTPSIDKYFDRAAANPSIRIPAGATDTEYVFKVRATFGSCFTEDEVRVTAKVIVPAPTARSGSLCGPGSVYLYVTGKPEGGYYNWYNADGTYITRSTYDNFLSPELQNSTIFLVSAVTAQGCESVKVPVSVVINPIPPAPKVLAILTYCQGGSASAMTAEGEGLKWYPSATTTYPYTSTPTPSTSAIGSTDYYVSQTVSGCESARAKVTVKVTAPPTAPTAVNASRCGAGSVTLQATGAPNGGSYRWYTATVGGASVASTSSYPTPTLNTSTSYYVSTVNGSGCESARTKVLATINELPTASIAPRYGPDSPSFCQGEEVTLISSTTHGYTYQWLVDGKEIEGATSQTYTTTRQGSYSVTVTSNGCSQTSNTIIVSVIPPISNNALSEPQTVCAGQEPGPINGSRPTGGNGPYSYHWEVSTTSATSGFYTAPGANNQENYTPGSISRTTWFRRSVYSGACYSISEAVKISTTPILGIPSNIRGYSNVCANQANVAYAIDNVSGAVGYTWSVPSDFTIVSGQGTSAIVVNAGNSSGVITVAATSTCGTSQASRLDVRVAPLPIVSAGAELALCAGAGTVTLSGYSPAGGVWSGKGVGANGIFDPATAGAGVHTLTYAVTQNGCTASATTTVTISETSQATLAAFQAVCSKQAAFALTGGQPAGGLYSGAGVSNGSFSPADAGAGRHEITYTYTKNGCTTSATKGLEVIETPTVSLMPLDNACSTDTAMHLPGGQPSGGSYSGPGVSNGIFNAVIAGVGTHEITYTYTVDGCTSTAKGQLTVATCTGLDESAVASGIVVFPNPTRSSIQVEAMLVSASNVTVRVFNVKGQLIYERSLKKKTQELKQVINLEGQTKGLYLLHIDTESGSINRKIIVE